MTESHLIDRISRGRTDLVFELLALPNWRELLHSGPIQPMQWSTTTTSRRSKPCSKPVET